MATTNDRDTWVGGLVFLALVLVTGLVYGPGLLTLGGLGPGSRVGSGAGLNSYPVTAVFNRVDGLFEGDEVRLAGIRIGTVGGQSLDANFRAVVTLNIDRGVVVPVDSAAAIHTDGLFGSKFVVLEPGVEDQNLAANGTLEYTQSAMIVGELLGLIIDEGRARQAGQQAGQQETTSQQQGN